MKIAFACDHRGLNLKRVLIDFVTEKGHDSYDFGTFSKESCDYPDYVYPACEAVREKKADRAIILCYTGVGSCIVANKVKGIRAALVFNAKMAVLARQHNNSNALVLPAYLLTRDMAKKIVDRWLKTEFEGGRHQRRLKKIELIEKKQR